MFLAFGLFIITCGFTHFMEIWTVWQAVYWLAGVVKAVCAVASVATAIALYPLLPKVFALVGAVKLSEERRLKLESANSELESFAYSVAHDLRAPLRAMKGTATVLMEDHGPALNEEAQQHLERISDASQRMDRLICELLEYSRISRVVPELRPVNLETVLAEAQHALSADIEKNKAEISIERPLPQAIGNPTLLSQVLTNLLGNAVKFVSSGVQPRIRIFTQKSDGVLRLCIEDNGIGIAPSHRTKIFGLFQRLHSAAEYPGTGVGLAIAEKAMSRMNGSLGFDSTPGKGSCFWIELPAG
jgi:signal transduction histidine kinase